MRAFVVTAPGRAAVQDVPEPVAGPGQVVVDVARVGVCGTDVEFFTGHMSYLHDGQAAFPMRLGHEWCGTVTAVGEGVDDGWLGRRVTGDTMLGCGRCLRCRSGRQHVCADRFEVGIRGGFPGALAERLAVPATSLLALPGEVDDVAGALVEPGGNALRAVRGAATGPGDRLLVLGSGTIGLLVALLGRASGARVHVLGQPGTLDLAAALGFGTSTRDDLPDVAAAGGWSAVVDASNAPALPALAVDLVEPGGRVVWIGLSGTPSTVDTRVVALKDVIAVGVLSASGGLAGTVEAYAAAPDRRVDPRPLVGTTVGLDGAAGALADLAAGRRPAGSGPGPKVHVDPRR